MPTSRSRPTWWAVPVALLLLAAMGVGLAALVVAFVRGLRAADPTIVVALMTASATVLASVLGVVAGRIFEQRQSMRAAQHQQWANLYQDFMRGWLKFLGLDQTKEKRKPMPPEELLEFLADFSTRAMAWASPGVLIKWARMRSLSFNAEADPDNGARIMVAFQSLILEMRKDLGHNDRELKDNEVLRIFITDSDEALRKIVQRGSDPSGPMSSDS